MAPFIFPVLPLMQDYSPVRVPLVEAPVPDMCHVYVVQVRCMHTNGTGYWSDWSDSVYSTPRNSRGETASISLLSKMSNLPNLRTR